MRQNEEAAKRAAERFEVAHVFTDYKKLLEMDEVDVVDVCTPNFLHAAPTIDAFDGRKTRISRESPSRATQSRAREWSSLQEKTAGN